VAYEFLSRVLCSPAARVLLASKNERNEIWEFSAFSSSLSLEQVGYGSYRESPFGIVPFKYKCLKSINIGLPSKSEERSNSVLASESLVRLCVLSLVTFP